MEDDETLANRRLGCVVGGNWILERVLGTGGVGAVYAAKNGLGQRAAIKILHGELARRKDVRERFLREGCLANRIDHEGALRVLEQGVTEEGTGYLVMELLEGETLTQLIRRDGPLGVRELFAYLDQVLDVLMAAHAVGIIHRDLKPDNLFITSSGKLKVLDYGLARSLSDIQGCFKTKTGLALGTLPYMAPEQARGRRAAVDGRADLFALGATAFRVLGRRKVHDAESEAELLLKMASEPAPKLGSIAPKVPLAAQQVIDLALAFAKEARYPDAATMQQDVRDVLAGRPPTHASSRLRSADSATCVQPAIVAAPLAGNVQRGEPTAPLSARPPKTEPLPISTPFTAAPNYAAAPPAWAPPPSGSPVKVSAAGTGHMLLLWLTLAGLVLVTGAAAALALLVNEGFDSAADTVPTPQQGPAIPQTARAQPASDTARRILAPAAAEEATPSAVPDSLGEPETERPELAEPTTPPAVAARSEPKPMASAAAPALPAPKRATQPEPQGVRGTQSSRLARPRD